MSRQLWRLSTALRGWPGVCLGLLLLCALPWTGEIFYIRLLTRIMIYAMVACSLDLILGYGGMVSFGHAAYFGAGAYVMAVLSQHGIHSGLLVWPLAVVATACLALLIGSVSLRTSGVYFIMITLAFAQMLYYCVIGLPGYGGDDGLRVVRNTFAGVLELRTPMTMYYVVLGCLVLVVWGLHRLVQARFGMVLLGIRENEPRMRALGYAVLWYKLVALGIAGGIAGGAGVLMANHTAYVSPALLHWTQSGEIMVMVILGGLGSLVGPVLGAVLLLVLEEVLSSYTAHWMLILGPLLLVVVRFAKHGVYGVWRSLRPGG